MPSSLSRVSGLFAGLLVIWAGASGCQKTETAGPSERLPPLGAPTWRVALPVEGFGAAVVAVPLGATSPRPVLIALHGDADRPEWQCGSWRGMVGSRAFVLCPRGRLRQDTPAADPRYALGSLEETEQELRGALKALKARFEGHVSKGPVLLAGHGPGADMAVLIAKQEPAFFARLVLISRGVRHFTPTVGSLFGKNGGQRVLFLCSSSECRDEAEQKALITRRAGAQAKVSHSPELGPWFDAAMVEHVRRELPWLVQGDPRWKQSAR